MAETVEWIDASGTPSVLEVEWDVQGRFAPPIAMEEEGVPGQPGTLLRSVRHLPRDFSLPLWITAASEAALRTALRELIATMDPIRGAGTVRVTGPGGDQREIVCHYRGGLEMSERLGNTSGPLLQRGIATFRAHDPYWQDTTDTSAGPWEIGTAPGSFFPFFPLRLSSSEIFAADTVINLGDVDAWPVWTITGPGSAISLYNVTTGKLLTLNATITAGSSVVIDTRPGHKTVTRSDGVNLYSSLSSVSNLWPLQPGANQIQIEMGGAAADVSSVSLLRRHRYLTA